MHIRTGDERPPGPGSGAAARPGASQQLYCVAGADGEAYLLACDDEQAIPALYARLAGWVGMKLEVRPATAEEAAAWRAWSARFPDGQAPPGALRSVILSRRPIGHSPP